MDVFPNVLMTMKSWSTRNKTFLSLDTCTEVKKIDDLPVSILTSIEKDLMIKEYGLDEKNVIKWFHNIIRDFVQSTSQTKEIDKL